MKIRLIVDSVLDPYEKHDKKWYPVAVKDLRGKNGKPYILNASEEIPLDCNILDADLYTWDGVLKIGKVKPATKK